MAVSDDDFVNGNLGIATLLKDPEAYKYVQQALNPGGDPAIAAALEDYYTQQNKKDPQTIAAIDAYVRQQTNKDAMLLLGFAAPGLASAVEIGGKVWQGDYAGAGKQAGTDAAITILTLGFGKAIGTGIRVAKTAIKEGKAADNVAVAVGEAAKDAAGTVNSGVRATASSAANENRLRHIFGNKSHDLDSLVAANGGSQEKALQALQLAANKALKEGRLTIGPNGILPGAQSGTILEVSGIKVQLVGGRVIDGEVILGSASRRFL
jgi:hypothetical protein